jgi:hypothetical protein
MPENPWSIPDPFPQTTPGDGEPALVTAGERLHLVWAHNQMLYHAYHTEDTGWSSPVQIAMGAAPALAVGAAGSLPADSLHCVFQNEFAGNSEIYYAAWDGTSWSLPINISHTSGASSGPALAAGPNGALYAAWTDTTSGEAVVYYAQRGENLWTSLPVPGGRGTLPALAVVPNGDLYVAWQDWRDETQRYDIFCAARLTAGEQWRAPEAVSDSLQAHSINPCLAATPRGTCHIVWQEEHEGIYQICYSDRRPNGWSAPVVVSAPDADCRSPRLASNTLGYLELVWLEGALLRHAVRPPDFDAPWWATETVATDCAALHELSLAISHAGKPHLTWSAGPADAGQLYYAERQPLFKHTVVLPIITK